MASLAKHHQSWILRYRLDGKRKKKSLGRISEVDAKTALKAANLQEDLANKGQAPSSMVLSLNNDCVGPTFEEFLTGDWGQDQDGYIEDFVARHPSSASDARSRFRENGPIRNSFGKLIIADGAASAWSSAWKSFENKRMKEVSANTVKHEWQYLSSALNQAVSYGICRRSVLQDAKFGLTIVRRKMGFFTPFDLDLIYSADENNAATFRFAGTVGLRRGEGVVAERSAVGRDEMRVITPKTEAEGVFERTVPLSEGAKEARERILWDQQRNDIGGKTFFEPVHRDTWTDRFRKARDRAAQKLCAENRSVSRSLESGTFHWLRHTFISSMVNDIRTPLPVVAKLAGHQSLAATLKYVHVEDAHVHQAISGLSSLGY